MVPGALMIGVRQLDLQGRPFLVHILQEYDLRQLQRTEHLPSHPKKKVYLNHQVKRWLILGFAHWQLVHRLISGSWWVIRTSISVAILQLTCIPLLNLVSLQSIKLIDRLIPIHIMMWRTNVSWWRILNSYWMCCDWIDFCYWLRSHN